MRNQLKSLVLFGLLLQATQHGSDAKQVAVEIDHRFGSQPARLHHVASESGVRLERVDYLLTDFALQVADSGTWIQADEQLAAYMSVGEGRHSAELGFVPSQKFQAIRFRIGVAPELNASDPNQFAADHPLNPLVNDLHWGWAGGYVFLALEGIANGKDAFSYHLANDGNSALVTIPATFDTARDCTIHLEFDIARLFSEIDFSTDAKVSHSRCGDAIAPKLKRCVAQAVSFSHLSQQRYQKVTPVAATTPVHGTPFPLQITGRFPKVALPQDQPAHLRRGRTRQGLVL